jgi:hypothetical protein
MRPRNAPHPVASRAQATPVHAADRLEHLETLLRKIA